MSSITQRNGRFLVRVRRDGFASVAKTFTKRADASAWGRRVEADMEAGRWVSNACKVPTLKEAIAEYRMKVAVNMKGAAEYAYRFDEFQALPFASKTVNTVTPFDLAAWRDEQMPRLKPGTVVRKLALLSGVLTWCVKERGWMTVNPLSLVRKPRVADGRNRTLSLEELKYLMSAASTSKAAWLSAALTVLMNSAMRRSELFGLRRQDVDAGTSTARLHDTKNGSARDVPLCPRSLAALHELDVAAQARGDVALLPFGAVGSLSTRFAVTVGRAQRAYTEDCAASGTECDAGFLVDVRLHDCRHHAVSAWANTGALSIVELMAISGHKTPRMLTRYAHISASALAGKLATLNA